MKRAFVTGGSGFIGTTLVTLLRDSGYAVLSVDLRRPRNSEHESVFREVDILDAPALVEAVTEFAPTHVVHLAARIDLDGQTPDDYRVNTAGTRNVIDAVVATPSIERTIFASTKLVCRPGYEPRNDEDVCPHTPYGQSKVEMEKIIRDSEALSSSWCIVRPSSIWGPWYSIPYHQFLMTVARGRYFHPGRCDPPKSFGYVENFAYQTLKLMDASVEAIQGNVFYLSDYEEFTIRAWSNAIAAATTGKTIRTIPSCCMRAIALVGDILKTLGQKRVPMSSFRLRNMWSDTTHIPLENTQALTGPLPFTMEQGVRRTADWMRREGLIE